MLNTISWGQFFTVVAIVSAIYYTVTILLLFREEIKSVFKSRNNSASDESESTIMGRTRPEAKRVPREEYVSGESLNFSRNEPDDPDQQKPDEELLTGAVADLLDEIKVRLSSMTDWKKDEAFGAFREILSRYPQLRSTGYRESVNYFIGSKCTDHFSWTTDPDEIDKLW